MATSLPRLLELTDYLKRGGYPSKNKLQAYLQGLGYDISQRSIERDLQTLKEEFMVEVSYHRGNRGYHLIGDMDKKVEDLTRLAEQFRSSELLRKVMQQGTRALDFIDLNHRGDLRGEGFLDELYNAIANRKNITLMYQSFDHTVAKEYSFSPWLLKYYQGRWYVAGETADGFRCFGVDRLEDVRPGKGKYIRCKGNAKDIFHHQIGIYGAGEKPVRVVFRASPRHAQFLQTLRMHHSQQKLESLPDAWVRFSLDVSINFELIQNFLMAGERVIVEQPKKLINELKKEIAQMHCYYF